MRGGTEMQTLNLVRVLIGAGHSVSTLCYFEYDPMVVAEYEQGGCTVELINLQRTIRTWKLISLLRGKIRRLKPDVMHVQYMAPGAIPILAARLAGVKKVLATAHHPYTKSHGKVAKLLLRFSALLCTRFIVVSQNAEKSWFGSGSLYNETLSLKKQARHFTIYNAVDVAQLQKTGKQTAVIQLKEKLGIDPNHMLIGVVSRLRHEKGIDILVNAFAWAIKVYPAIHLLIVGTGPDEKKLKEQTVENGIDKNCTFYGKAGWETAMQLMTLMDVVVVPSRFEGFGLTAAEAMAMGKPVIASDVFGLSEVVSDGQTGLLFPSEDTRALTNCIVSLCNDLNLRSTLGANGLIKAEKMFDIAVFNQKTIHLYNDLQGNSETA